MSSKDPSEARIQGAGPLLGEFRVPGDKSVSHRAALLGALAAGPTTIDNFVRNRDCIATLDCVEALGVEVDRNPSRIRIEGRGRGALRPSGAVLDCQNSGTTFRLLMGLLAGCEGEFTLTGDASLRSRPMERVAGPLRRMGAGVVTSDGHAPVTVSGRSSLQPIVYEPVPPSAQVKSAILLAGLAADGRTTVVESVRTRNHSELMLPVFGAGLSVDQTTVHLDGPQELFGAHVSVPGDVSSAAFLIVAALMVPDSRIVVRGVGINPSRTGFLSILDRLGACVRVIRTDAGGGEPTGDVEVEYSGELVPRTGGDSALTPGDVARAIDEIPILAVLATQVRGGLSFHGAGDLRRKESDRIRAMTTGLRAMGARVDEWEDGFSVAGPAVLSGARINPDHDHRIAMSFACAGLAASGETVIETPEVADVSFPGFFELLPSGALRI